MQLLNTRQKFKKKKKKKPSKTASSVTQFTLHMGNLIIVYITKSQCNPHFCQIKHITKAINILSSFNRIIMSWFCFVFTVYASLMFRLRLKCRVVEHGIKSISFIWEFELPILFQIKVFFVFYTIGQGG